MKKKITSKADLQKAALNQGAVVTGSNGQKFNASKKKAVKRKPVEEPKRLEPAKKLEKPTPPLNPESADEGSKMVVESLNSMSKANVLMLAELKKQIAAIQLNAAQPITGWEFDLIRDDKGYTTKILANAITEERTIN